MGRAARADWPSSTTCTAAARARSAGTSETMMPPGGAEPRGEVLATLTRLAHERTTDDGLLELLDELDPWAERELPEDDVRARPPARAAPTTSSAPGACPAT